MKKKNDKKNFEQNIERLQEISNLLNSENIGLDESIELYEEGVEISKVCMESLKTAKLKIKELKKDLDVFIDDKEED